MTRRPGSLAVLCTVAFTWASLAVAQDIMPGSLAATMNAQDAACSAEAAVDSARITSLRAEEFASWAEAPLSTGTSLSEELRSYGISMSEFSAGRKIALTLPGNRETSIYVLARESLRQPLDNTWVMLYSVAPTAVRLELEHQGIVYPWSGFVVTMDDRNGSGSLRVGMLGQPDHQLEYNPVSHQFQRVAAANLAGESQVKASEGCMDCILGLVKEVACEFLADTVACLTVAGCPGAVISALVRASWKLLTQDVCFPANIALCAFRCGMPEIKITPASNTILSPGKQQITVNISGTNAGAWVLPVPQNGRPGAPMIRLGGNPRVVEWNASAGVYTIYAGSIPLTGYPGIQRNTNVVVGQVSFVPVNWTITDGCSDNRGLRVRFFDKTRGGVFPSASSYFVIPVGSQKTLAFNAPRGSRICIGAGQDPPSSRSWCYGINGTADGSYSATCCAVVPETGALTLSNRLICTN